MKKAIIVIVPLLVITSGMAGLFLVYGFNYKPGNYLDENESHSRVITEECRQREQEGSKATMPIQKLLEENEKETNELAAKASAYKNSTVGIDLHPTEGTPYQARSRELGRQWVQLTDQIDAVKAKYSCD